MPDFWDKLFKTNLGDGDATFAIHAVTSTLMLYAQGVITKGQIVSTLVDSAGSTLTTAEQVQMTIMTDAIDAESGAASKVLRALRINASAMLAELGQIDKSTAKTLAGV
jgi:hypothetical protein